MYAFKLLRFVSFLSQLSSFLCIFWMEKNARDEEWKVKMLNEYVNENQCNQLKGTTFRNNFCICKNVETPFEENHKIFCPVQADQTCSGKLDSSQFLLLQGYFTIQIFLVHIQCID